MARQELRRELEAWGLGQLADAAELVLSELFSNAVRHARSPRGRQIETRYEHVWAVVADDAAMAAVLAHSSDDHPQEMPR